MHGVYTVLVLQHAEKGPSGSGTWGFYCIREYGSTLYVGLSRFPHRANTNRYCCNSLASKHFRPKFETKKLQIILPIPLIDLFLVAITAFEIFVL